MRAGVFQRRAAPRGESRQLQKAGVNVVRLVNEPTAAALAYGFNRSLQQKICSSTTWAAAPSMCRSSDIDGNVFEVIATGGDNFLGGSDFDNR